jgi:endonuclease/exonuclease/phosphatase family metal-dependent hydrolase
MYFMKFTYIIGLLIVKLSLFSQVFCQSTYVYFQNNTSLSLAINTVQYGDAALSPSEWDNNQSAINPWQLSSQVMRTNRTTGITNGSDFYFDIFLSGSQDTVVMEIQLTGTLFGSNMWHSTRGTSFDHPWYSDNQFYEQSLIFEGKNCTLKYQSAFTGSYDDITFTLHENDPYIHWPADDTNPNILNTMSYNIFMLTPPLSLSEQNTRAEHLKNSVEQYDVVFIQEAFDNTAREDYLIPELSPVFPYHTAVLDIPGTVNEDGGTMFFSKWPIEYDTGHVFQSCYSFECLSNKGVSYARINKLGQIYHLFNTHTQAFIGAEEIESRKNQIKEIRTFIDYFSIPASEPVIVGGDLNIDLIANHSNEYDSMLILLNAIEPDYTGHPYTFQPELNYYATSGPLEYLDYLLPIADFKQPVSFFNEARIIRQIVDPMWGKFDMSDHFAVYSRFEYNTVSIEESTPQPLRIYPNPTQDYLNLECSGDAEFSIYSLEGKLILSDNISNHKIIQLNCLEKGMYLLNVNWENGQRETVKILVE